MKLESRFGLLSLVVAAAVACGEAPKPAPASTPAPAPAAPAAAAPAAAAPAAAASVGVPECDDFLTKYQACVDSKVPDAMKPTVKQSIDQMRSSWAEAAKTPQGKSGLATACKQSLDAAKASMSAYSCSW